MKPASPAPVRSQRPAARSGAHPAEPDEPVEQGPAERPGDVVALLAPVDAAADGDRARDVDPEVAQRRPPVFGEHEPDGVEHPAGRARPAHLELCAVVDVLRSDFPDAALAMPYAELRQRDLGGLQASRLLSLPVALA